jgi:hypothetical protein
MILLSIIAQHRAQSVADSSSRKKSRKGCDRFEKKMSGSQPQGSKGGLASGSGVAAQLLLNPATVLQIMRKRIFMFLMCSHVIYFQP